MATRRVSAVALGLWLALPCLAQSSSRPAASAEPNAVHRMVKMDDAKFSDWLQRWEKYILEDARKYRYCDKDNGESIGWHMMPQMDGFYYGYLATRDTKWVDLMVDWADSWFKRGVKEPDGYVGWPRVGAAGTLIDKLDDWNADSLLGEAMGLRPVVLMSGEILKTPALKEKYGAKAEGYVKLAEQTYEKWDKRGAWRETKDGGVMTVVLPYGYDANTAKWIGFEKRNDPGNGFSHPNNKANHTARWLLAMFDVTGKPIYRERAEKWFKLMKSRMKPKADGTFEIWPYWEPAGPWDYKPDGKPKHGVFVHKAGYYNIDVEGIVAAYEHGLVFTKADIGRLVATAIATKRNWTALVPYSAEIQKEYEEKLQPDTWSGISGAPWYLWLQSQLRGGGR